MLICLSGFPTSNVTVLVNVLAIGRLRDSSSIVPIKFSSMSYLTDKFMSLLGQLAAIVTNPFELARDLCLDEHFNLIKKVPTFNVFK